MTVPENLLLDPEWQPFAYDAAADALTFVHAPREIQRRRTFLDARFLEDRPKAGPVALKALPRDLIRAQAAPVHFIFHTAFCCSTLLARAFDQPGAAMGLKEPAVLVSFADALPAHGNSFAYQTALSSTLDLLARPLSPGETQIIKPTNLVNPLVPQLLDTLPAAKAIIMHSPLESYLKTTAKNSLQGRSFNREALMQLKSTIPLHPDLNGEVMMRLTDLEVAALVWLMQVQFLSGVISRLGSARVRTLSAAALLTRPAEALQQAGDHFEVALKDATWEEVAAGPLFHEHAKAPGRRFDANARRAELEAAGNAHAPEISAVLEWAQGLADKLNASVSLGDTLLSSPPTPVAPEPTATARPV